MAETHIPFVAPNLLCCDRVDEVHEVLREVLRCDAHCLSESVEGLERDFAAWLCASGPLTQPPYTLGVASGTDAVELALRGFFSLNPDVAPITQGGHSPSSVVFAPSHGPVALASAIERAGALPVLVDVDPYTMTVSPSSLAQTVDEARCAGHVPAAVVALHIYGHPCDMRLLELVAQDAGLWILEDCAYAMGAEYTERRVGTLSEAAAFSCAPGRNLWSLGNAGLLSTGFQPLADELDALRRLGAKYSAVSSTPGVNSNLDPLEAAVLRVNMRYLEQDQQRRRSIAERYNEAFKESSVLPPFEAPWAKHAWNMYVLRVPGKEFRRNKLREHLLDCGIGVPVETVPPLHMQPAYRERVLISSGGLTETLNLYEKTLSLPLYPGMTDDAVQQVIDAVRRWQG